MNASNKKNHNLMVAIIVAVAMAASAFVIITLIENARADTLIREYIENVSSDELTATDFIVYGFDVTDDGFVFEPTSNTIVKYIGNETNIVIPSRINGTKVKVIYENAFYNKNIETLSMPDTVAFNNNNLTNVVTYDSTTTSDSNESIIVRIPNKLNELEAQIHDNAVITSNDLRRIENSRRRTRDFERSARRIIRRLNYIWE